MLWARSGGRCEFSGCNRLLYRSPVTQEGVNLAEKAHVYSFSVGGPRGRGPYAEDPTDINEIQNLLLVCHDCHKKIDSDPERYPADLLKQWKDKHETRVEVVTGIDPLKKSHVLLYSAAIGAVGLQVVPSDAINAMFPDWYPASYPPIQIAMSWRGRDSDPEYWRTERFNLIRAFEKEVGRHITGETHVSVFALAPIPLLVQLGALLTDQVPAVVYQRHREPQTWRWLDGPTDGAYHSLRPGSVSGVPALVLSLSDRIAHNRVERVLGDDVAIWEFTVENPHNDFLRSPDQLTRYRRSLRRFIDEIGAAHGKDTPIHVFPAVPVACAVDLGRIRMPKADAPWMLYDENPATSSFEQAFIVGGSDAG